MKELNEELVKILNQLKVNDIDLENAMVKFDSIFTKFKKHSNSNEFLIDSLQSDFYNVLHKISKIKDIDFRLNNNEEINLELRKEIGLI